MNKNIEITTQIDNFSKNRGFGRIFWITQIFALFTAISSILFLVLNSIFQINIFTTLILPVFITGILFLILDAIGGIFLSSILNSLKQNNIKLGEIHNKVEEIGEILNIGNTIFELVQKLMKFRYFLKIFYPKKIQSYNKLFKVQYSIILSILLDLRSNLSIRLTEQQQSLESAKSEVEKNIKGSTELNQVSELQKARLDKQIEQFEELQRVLVKV